MRKSRTGKDNDNVTQFLFSELEGFETQGTDYLSGLGE
jgi:hypothetical protein